MWGTERRPAHDLFRSLLRGTEIKVEDDVVGSEGESRKVLNPVATEAAREKAEALSERFSEWVWEDANRATRLQQNFNRQFNSLVARNCTEEGQRLTLPGLAADFTPHPHQRSAVARMVAEPAVGLFHQVGAGKTAAMVMGLTEIKRRGLITKPIAVVPGHMLEQFTREWQQLYPNARLLSAGADDIAIRGGDTSARRTFIARAAMNDWDGIVMTHSAFEKIPVSDATLKQFSDHRISALRETLENLNSDPDVESKRTAKQIQSAISRDEQRIRKALADRDVAGLTLEDMGVDYAAVDEGHLFKNLRTFSNIPSAGIDGSQCALDMEMKIDYLRRTYGERVVTMATGTPVANSITETHVMMRYLRPDLLEKAGVQHFDDWANTFGELVTRFERDAAGRLKQATRFSKFKNVPEMLGTWQQFADVKMSEDLQLDVPDIRPDDAGECRPKMEVIPRSEALATYMADLEDRLDRLKGTRPEKGGADNHLTVYSDGRRAAVDPRLVDLETTEYVKLDRVAANIAEVWKAERDNEYTLPGSDEVSPNRGGLQIVFCDISTPNPEKWNVYHQLRGDLVEKYGMDAGRIRFIHEAGDDEQKAAMFRAAREGDIDVLIGSSEKMGTGANIQLRAAALHHVDCPWRPAELTQREGRILRHGNQNAEVSIFKYATENSFDSTAWDVIARKATAIHQLMKGRIDVRELDDPGDMALDAQELMAASSGNPLLLEKVELDTEVSKLERRARAHDRQEQVLASRHLSASNERAFASEAAAEVASLAARSTETKGEKFRADVAGRSYTSRREATDAVVDHVINAVGSRGLAFVPARREDDVVSLGGHSFSFSTTDKIARAATVTFRMDGSDLTATRVEVPWRDLVSSSPPNLAVVLENRITGLPRLGESFVERQMSAEKELGTIEGQWKRPFKNADRLADAKRELAAVDAKMRASVAPDDPSPAVQETVQPAGIAGVERSEPASSTRRSSTDVPAPSAGTAGQARRAPERSGAAEAGAER